MLVKCNFYCGQHVSNLGGWFIKKKWKDRKNCTKNEDLGLDFLNAIYVGKSLTQYSKLDAESEPPV